MKKCRHCRTDNEDAATICTECGLDLSPSPAAKLVRRLPSAFRGIDTKWLWRISLIVGLPILLLALYLLSLGPIFRFYGAKPPNVWSRVPSAVRVIYEPLDRLPIPGPLARMLRHYNYWWMDVEGDKKKLSKLFTQIDISITNGMPQNQVVGFLGPPIMWSTNGNMIEATYEFVPLGRIPYGSFTSGFTMTFSNSVVLRKSPVISSFQ
jgi:hypothetical protein